MVNRNYLAGGPVRAKAATVYGPTLLTAQRRIILQASVAGISPYWIAYELQTSNNNVTVTLAQLRHMGFIIPKLQNFGYKPGWRGARAHRDSRFAALPHCTCPYCVEARGKAAIQAGERDRYPSPWDRRYFQVLPDLWRYRGLSAAGCPTCADAGLGRDQGLLQQQRPSLPQAA